MSLPDLQPNEILMGPLRHAPPLSLTWLGGTGLGVTCIQEQTEDDDPPISWVAMLSHSRGESFFLTQVPQGSEPFMRLHPDRIFMDLRSDPVPANRVSDDPPVGWVCLTTDGAKLLFRQPTDVITQEPLFVLGLRDGRLERLRGYAKLQNPEGGLTQLFASPTLRGD